jgi:16S rRNA (cytidine1402-2'-O)-methyltransferase
MSGKLYVIGTPIGNIEDLTFRAVRKLFEVEVLLCEDTRQTGKLLEIIIKQKIQSKLEKPKLVRFDETKERVMTRKVVADLVAGQQIGLVTDAGMPGVSDPGLHLVNACYEAGIPVEVIPGPSALTTALVASGFEGEAVIFLGFLPKKKAEREKKILALKRLSAKSLGVIYESPFRLRQLIQELQANLQDPELTACGELTKLHEKVLRGKASEVLGKLFGNEPASAKATTRQRGEWVVVVKLGSK